MVIHSKWVEYMANRNKFRGDRLKLIREKRGFTQDELNTRLGFGNTTVYRYETGRSEPSPDALIGMARELEVTADYLLGLVDEPNDYLTEDDLTPEERRLIDAFRRGDLKVAMRIFVKETGAG